MGRRISEREKKGQQLESARMRLDRLSKKLDGNTNKQLLIFAEWEQLTKEYQAEQERWWQLWESITGKKRPDLVAIKPPRAKNGQ